VESLPILRVENEISWIFGVVGSGRGRGEGEGERERERGGRRGNDSSAGMRLSQEGGVEGEEWEKLEREG
jgi:hypothetical protein